jgi:uncharacterized protein YhaN
MNNAVQILRQERDKTNEQIKALRIRLKELDAAINVLEGQSPVAKLNGRSKDMKSLVVEVIEAAGFSGLLVKDILSELSKRGKETTEASLASTLSRLKSDEKLWNDRGMWISTRFQSVPGDDDFDYSDYGFDDPHDVDEGVADL